MKDVGCRVPIDGTKRSLSDISDVVIVDDNAKDAQWLAATLRVLVGYSCSIRQSSTLLQAMDLVLDRRPDVVVLDDVLKPSDDAVTAVGYLRGLGFNGAIVVVSAFATRNRSVLLRSHGVCDVVHKDDLDSARLAQALLAALAG